MRLKLTLLPLYPNTAVPLNYSYPLSAAIYKFLAAASPDYAVWLHDNGYKSRAERLMKLFTFSRLNIPLVQMRDGKLISDNKRPWLLKIGSPMESDFVQNFVLGLFQEQKLEIGQRGVVGRFQIAAVEALPDPPFKPDMGGKPCRRRLSVPCGSIRENCSPTTTGRRILKSAKPSTIIFG